MYKVFCDGLPLHDLRDEQLVLQKPIVKLKDNTVGSFDFSILPIHPYFDKLRELISEVTVYQDDELLFSGRIVETKSDFRNRKTVHCESDFAFLNDSIQRPANYSGMTVRDYLYELVNIHNSQVEPRKQFILGMVTVRDSNDYVYKFTNYETTLEVFKSDLIDTYGGHFRIRKEDGINYLDYLADYPAVNTQSIQFGSNLLDFIRNDDLSDIATAVIPLGARLETDTPAVKGLEDRLTIESVNGGLDYVCNSKFANQKIFKIVKFDDVHVPAILKKKGEEYLSDVQYKNISLTVKAVDLHMMDVDFERFKMLDEVRVISEPNKLNRRFPITEMTIHLDSPVNNTITLGKTVKSGITGSQSDANKDVLNRIEKIPSKESVLTEASKNASELIHNATSGHVVTRPDELLIMDTDDTKTARKLWRWNINGLGYSNTGYNGNYGLAMTMDGQILGDRLVAGSVSADKLDVKYKTTIQKQISDAELNATNHTDTELKKYWTKSEVETEISNKENSILLSAKETATNYTDEKLKNYSTSSQIKVQTDKITQEVNKKVNNTEFGTKIQQNAESVRIAWNGISNYIKFESAELRIYNESNNLICKFGKGGEHFYFNKNVHLGSIGSSHLVGKDSWKGLSNLLDWDGKYIDWASKDTAGGEYRPRLRFTNFTDGNVPWGFHFMAPLYVHDNLHLSNSLIFKEFKDGAGFRGGKVYYCKSNNASIFTVDPVGVSAGFWVNLNMHNYKILNQSDARIKTNIQDTKVNALDVINSIDLKEYDWIQSGEHEKIGIIAQQLLEVEPELVEDAGDTLTIKTTDFVFYLIKAIQELSGKNTKSSWKDPYTELEKKAFCKRLEDKEKIENIPIEEPTRMEMI